MYTASPASNALAAIIPSHPSILTSTEFLLSGFVVVMAVLGIMTVFMYFLGYVFAPKAKKAAVAAAPAAPEAVAAPAAQALPQENPHLVAVLTAAAFATLGSSVKIVSVQPVSTEWSTQGRRDIFASRQIR